MNRRTAFLVFPLLLAACKREPEIPAGVISRDKFVAANVAVRTLPDSAPQAQRDAALKKAGVTDRQLRTWVTAYSRQPELLAKTWEEIAFKVDSIGGAPPGVVGGPSGGIVPPGVPSPPTVELERPRPRPFRGDSMRQPPRRRPRPLPDDAGDRRLPPAQ